MQKLTRLALMLTAVGIMTGCRIYEEQKAMIVRSATAAVLTPLVEAQRTTPLTQGTFREAPTVAPNNGSTTAVEKPSQIVTAKRVEQQRSEPALRPCQSTFSRQLTRRYRVVVEATRPQTVVGG